MPTTTDVPSGAPVQRGVLARLGLDRPELRAWAMYDWANSAMMTIVVTAVFPIYYSRVAAAPLAPADATLRFTQATTIALAIVALLSPLLGALADFGAIKKRMLGLFMAVGVTATALLFLVQQGDWVLALVLFGLANIGVNGSYVFYDSLLPHITRDDEIDRVSSAGYALGYLGGGIMLALALACILKPALFGLPSGEGLTAAQQTLPSRLAFLATAVWWTVFSIPLFRRVPEPSLTREPDEPLAPGLLVRAAFSRLGETLRELRGYRNAFVLLLASLIYSDGINTIIRMATVYGTELGIRQNAQIAAIVLVQFVGIPFAFLFGALASRIGAKRAILIGLAVYAGISILGYFMRTELHFFALAFMVGTVQGGTQALSRSLFASMIPRHKSGEFFGFYAVFERFGAILGPLLFGLVLSATGSSRNGILSIISFFVVGAGLLMLVDVAEGQRVARAADADLRRVPA
jgi:UMF1 family MFS transporter